MIRSKVRRLCDEYPEFLRYPVNTNDESFLDSLWEENPFLKTLDSMDLDVLEHTLRSLKDEQELKRSKKLELKWTRNDDLDASILSSF